MELKLPLKLFRSPSAEYATIVDGYNVNLIGGVPIKLATHIVRAVNAEEANRKDSERIDWMDAVNSNINNHYKTKYGWKWDVNHNRACLSDCNWPALTVRQAIDEAMNSVKASREKALGIEGRGE